LQTNARVDRTKPKHIVLEGWIEFLNYFSAVVSIVLKNAVLKDIERLAKASKVGILDGYKEVVADNGGVVS